MKSSRILRSTGLDPLGQPVRRGPNYVLRAIDDNDREVSVVVSARSGDVLSVTPVQTASRMPPPRGGVTHGAPTSGCRRAMCRRAAIAPERRLIDDDDEPNIVDNPNAPRPPGAMPGAPPMRSSNAAPLPPRSGAMQPDDDELRRCPSRTSSRPIPIAAACCRRRRSVSRSARRRPRQPKPVKRAAAAPPKQAPLPKPKPAAKVDAPPAPAAAGRARAGARRPPRPPKRRRTAGIAAK